MARWARNQFRGIDTATEPHLLGEGHVANMRNLLVRGGALRTRRGFVRVSDLADSIGPYGVDQWPSLLFSFDPEGIGNESDPSGGSAIETPEEPYGTVETPPDPVADDGGLIDSGITDDDTGEFIIRHDDPAYPAIQAWLPGTIYDRCRFTLRFASAAFDGTGAALAAYLFDDAGAAASASLNLSQAITTGWASGLWEGTGRVSADTDDVSLYAICTATDRAGVSASASVDLPAFTVALPAEIDAGDTVTITITCVQTGYEGDGYGMTLAIERYDATSETWETLSTTGLAALTSGWSSGVWADDFTLGDLAGSTQVRAVLTYRGRAADQTAQDTMTVDLSPQVTVDLPAYVDAYTQDVLSLAVIDAAGNGVDDFDTTRLALVWEYSAAATGPWTAFDPLSLEAFGPTWADGTAELDFTLAPEALQVDGYLRVTASLDGAEAGTDTARLDFDYATNVIAAIRERQQAAGVATPDLIPAGTTALADLCTHANKFTTSPAGSMRWLTAADSAWAGGASAPAFHTPSATHFGIVGSGATVEVASAEALYLAVIAFQRGYIDASVGSAVVDGERYSGSSSWESSVAAAKAAAAADWAPASDVYVPGASASISAAAGGSTWQASLGLIRVRPSASCALDTRLARRLRLYAKGSLTADSAPYYYFFASQGFGMLNGQYVEYSDDSRAAAADNQGTYPQTSAAPSSWPTTPATGDTHTAGFWNDGLALIVDPEFTY